MKSWVERLITEYADEKKQLEAYRKNLDKGDAAGKAENETVGGMISDMQYALEWMRRGRRPGNRRGIERQSVYQRTALLDPDIFPSLDVEPAERRLTDEERRKITDILWSLSIRERQCYLLHVSRGLSYSEIAEELKISRRTVQQYVERARKKIFNK